MGAKPRYSEAMLRAWHDRQAQYWELICTGNLPRALAPKGGHCPLCIVAEREVAEASYDRKRGFCADCVLLADADLDFSCYTGQGHFRATASRVLARKKPFAYLSLVARERLEMLQEIAHRNGAPILTREQWWEEKCGKTPRQSASEILEKPNAS